MLRKVVFLTLVLARGAAAQFTNQAQWYNGNFDWTTTLGLQGPVTDGIVGLAVENVSVGIAAGKAFCKGSFHNTEDTYQAGKLISRATTVGSISGPGFALIEFGIGTDTLPGKPIYTITVTCPTHSGTVTTQSFVPGGSGETDSIKAMPANQGHHEWSTYSVLDTRRPTGMTLTRADTLKGGLNLTHPDADPSNNVVGSLKLSWSLTLIP